MDLDAYRSFLWLLAHPDDEVYTINILKKLIDCGRSVDIAYATSGDYEGDDVASMREAEVHKVAKRLGLGRYRVHFLRFSERLLFDSANRLQREILSLASGIHPECIVGHHFEAGHNGHDLVSYCTAQAASSVGADHWVFPAYYGQPSTRVFNAFEQESGDDYHLYLDATSRKLKRSVIDAHQTQKDFFDRLLRSSSAAHYMDREVLRHIISPIDYMQKPTSPVGYEFEGSSLKFSDYATVIGKLNSSFNLRY